MRKALVLVGLFSCGLLVTGCGPKSPEQEEAAKFSQVKQNTPEEEKAMRERLHLGQPLQGNPGTGVAPDGSNGPKAGPK